MTSKTISETSALLYFPATVIFCHSPMTNRLSLPQQVNPHHLSKPHKNCDSNAYSIKTNNFSKFDVSADCQVQRIIGLLKHNTVLRRPFLMDGVWTLEQSEGCLANPWNREWNRLICNVKIYLGSNGKPWDNISPYTKVHMSCQLPFLNVCHGTQPTAWSGLSYRTRWYKH